MPSENIHVSLLRAVRPTRDSLSETEQHPLSDQGDRVRRENASERLSGPLSKRQPVDPTLNPRTASKEGDVNRSTSIKTQANALAPIPPQCAFFIAKIVPIIAVIAANGTNKTPKNVKMPISRQVSRRIE